MAVCQTAVTATTSVIIHTGIATVIMGFSITAGRRVEAPVKGNTITSAIRAVTRSKRVNRRASTAIASTVEAIGITIISIGIGVGIPIFIAW